MKNNEKKQTVKRLEDVVSELTIVCDEIKKLEKKIGDLIIECANLKKLNRKLNIDIDDYKLTVKNLLLPIENNNLLELSFSI